MLVSRLVPPYAALLVGEKHMSRLPSPRMSRGLAVCATLLLLAACQGKKLPPLEALTPPDLGSAEAAVRQQVSGARDTLDRAIAKGEPIAAAAAFGTLGEIYFAYDLGEPAAVCLRNAETLDPGSFVWPYQQGLVAKAAGDFAAARRHFERAASKNPGYPQALAHLAEVAFAAGDLAFAETQLAARDGKGAVGSFRLTLGGRARLAAGDPAGALTRLEKAAKLAPTVGEVQQALGQALRQLGRGDEAAAHLAHEGGGNVAFPDPLQERISQQALSAGALLKRGNQALVAGRNQDAEAIFRRGIEASPDNAELRLNLALTLVRQGRLDDAIATLEEVIARDGNNARAYHDLGNVYRAKNQNDAAVEAFRKAIALEPSYASAQFNLANTLIALERWNEAAPAIEKTLALTPQDSRARYLQAMVLRAQGQVPAAIAKLRALLAAEPTNRVAREGLSDTLATAGKIAEALELYRSTAAAPTTTQDEAVQLLDDAAKLAWRQNLRDQSVQLWRQAVEKHPQSAKAHLNLGNGLQLMNRRDEAKVELAKAVELDPADSNARLSLAALRILTKDFAAARENLEAGLAIKEDQPALLNTLARLLATCPEANLRDGRRAFEMAQRAFALEARLEHAETVAMALAEMGQFEQAIRWQRGLAQQAQQRGDRAVLNRLVATLRTYEKRQPIRAN